MRTASTEFLKSLAAEPFVAEYGGLAMVRVLALLSMLALTGCLSLGLGGGHTTVVVPPGSCVNTDGTACQPNH
jgi:hypothetical protein